MSLEIIGIGYNSSEMDIDRYSGNSLFKVEAGNGRRKMNRKRFCMEGDDEPPAFLSLACMFGEALKTNEKEKL